MVSPKGQAVSLVLQPGPEQTPLGDEFVGASRDRREIARLLDVAARFGRGQWGAACTDMVQMPKLLIQVAGALLCGVIGPRCEVIGYRRSM